MKNLFLLFRWQDLFDIAFITVIIYGILVFLKGTRALKIVVAIALLFIAYFITDFLHLYTLNWLLNNFIASIIIIIVVIFSPEIRRGLMVMGRGAILRARPPKHTESVEEIVRAANAMSLSKMGALIVFQREDDLKEYMEDATLLNAKVTKELLLSLFHPAAPLHDGAVIVKDGTVRAAGCFLPLSTRSNLSKSLGTRHRAAIGITEDTDAVCVVISEETGAISVAADGKITMRLNEDVLDKMLFKLLFAMKRERKA